jgi:MFS family permease
MDGRTATPPASPKKSGLFINRNFGLLWTGQTVSVIGDYILNTTLVIWVAQLTVGQSWSPLAVSAVLLAASVPIALFGPMAGVFVDRWDKRRTMIRTDGLRAVLVALLILATGVVPLPFVPGGQFTLAEKLGAVYGIVFIINAADRFFRPATFALIGDIIPPDDQPRAFGFVQTAASLAIIVGPPIAAPLLIAFGPEWALLIDAGTFIVSLLTILAIHAPTAARSVEAGERGHFLREFGGGLRFVFTNGTLVVLLLVALIVMLGGGALNALDIFFVTGNLHTPVNLYGLLGSAQGLGLIVGALTGGLFATRLKMTRVVWLALVTMGIFIVAYARMTLFWPAVALIFIMGLPNGALNVVTGPLILRIAPREMVGRVTSLLDPVIMIASIIGTAIAGYLDAVALRGFHADLLGMTFGPVDTIFMGAGALVFLGGLLALARLREPASTTTAEPAGTAEIAETAPIAPITAPAQLD